MKLFQAQDAVYAHLWLLNPTSVEKIETRQRIEVMGKLWGKIQLPVTPKAHLVFDHAVEQMRVDHILSKMHGVSRYE